MFTVGEKHVYLQCIYKKRYKLLNALIQIKIENGYGEYVKETTTSDQRAEGHQFFINHNNVMHFFAAF